VADDRYIGCVGGQVDFMHAAMRPEMAVRSMQ
jgi:hypothetical protein